MLIKSIFIVNLDNRTNLHFNRSGSDLNYYPGQWVIQVSNADPGSTLIHPSQLCHGSAYNNKYHTSIITILYTAITIAKPSACTYQCWVTFCGPWLKCFNRRKVKYLLQTSLQLKQKINTLTMRRNDLCLNCISKMFTRYVRTYFNYFGSTLILT